MIRLAGIFAASALLAACGVPGNASAANDADPANVAVAETEAVQNAAPAVEAPPPQANQTAPALPADVAAFKEKRDSCDHFRGEEPYDAERGAFLAKQLEATCKGTDKALADLRARYAGDAAAKAALADYETQVE